MTMFEGYPTYDYIYKRGHTNVPGVVLGMATAYWVYDRQKTGGDLKSLRVSCTKYELSRLQSFTAFHQPFN